MGDSMFAENTPIAIAASFAIVAFLVWRIKPDSFRRIPWQAFGIASAIFWGIFAALLISLTWNFYYMYLVPDWYIYAAPIGAVVLYSNISIFIRWASIRLPGNPTLWFCLFGGLEALPEHAIGIYRFDILDIPMLAGSSEMSLFIFAFFEYVIYWGIVLGLTLGTDRVLRNIKGSISSRPIHRASA